MAITLSTWPGGGGGWSTSSFSPVWILPATVPARNGRGGTKVFMNGIHLWLKHESFSSRLIYKDLEQHYWNHLCYYQGGKIYAYSLILTIIRPDTGIIPFYFQVWQGSWKHAGLVKLEHINDHQVSTWLSDLFSSFSFYLDSNASKDSVAGVLKESLIQ